MKFTCKICGVCTKTIRHHLMTKHGYTDQEYYNEYVLGIKNISKFCPICGNLIKFNGRNYNSACSQYCAALYRISQYDYEKLILDFETKNNCTKADKLRKKYGQGWYKSGIINDYIKVSIKGIVHFVKNEDIQKIIEYNIKYRYKGKSRIEDRIFNYIQNRFKNLEIRKNDKFVIYPSELDIYIPNLRLAIEYNGTYWHSVDRGGETSKTAHLNKSLLCRSKNIRLIHIYEFENLENQLQNICSLINGKDLYDYRDFNKNNLIDLKYAEPIEIHKDRYTIYGAGRLY